MDITQQVEDILKTINSKFGDLNGSDCSKVLIQLSVLLYNILMEEAESEGMCNTLMVEGMKTGDSKAAAEVKMKSGGTYQTYCEIKALRIGMEETIRTLKVRIRVLSDQYNQT